MRNQFYGFFTLYLAGILLLQVVKYSVFLYNIIISNNEFSW